MDKIIFAECTHAGQVRSLNEDSMASFDSPNGHVVVVCDGMGGQNAGDVASQLAIQVIKDILTDNTFSSPAEAITRSVVAANQAILHRAAADENLTGMGATCVILIVKDGKVYYGSVGDSRIYYLTGNDIRQLTRDQSYVQALVDAGELTAAEAEHHQDKNQITNALGVDGMTPPEVNPMPLSPDPGSIFLLCSDGLSNMVSNAGIQNILVQKNVTLQQRAEALITAANNAGGLDNITVQLVEFPSKLATVPPTPTEMKKEIKKNKTITYIFAALTVLIIGGGIAYFVVGGNNEPEPIAPQPVQTTSKPAAKPKKPTPVIQKKEVVIVKEEKAPAKNTKSKNKTPKETLGGTSSSPSSKEDTKAIMQGATQETQAEKE